MTDIGQLDERGRRLALRERMSAEEDAYPPGGIAVPPDGDTMTAAGEETGKTVQTGTENGTLSSFERTEPTAPVGELPTETEPD